MPTTDKTPDTGPTISDELDAVAEWLDAESKGSDDPERAERIAANKLHRFAAAVEIAAVIAAAQDKTGSAVVLTLALDRGPNRDHLPALAHVPLRLNKAQVWTTGTVNVHASDTVSAVLASIDGAVAMVTDPPVVPEWSKSASERTPLRDALGRSTGQDLLAQVKTTDEQKRTPWTFSAVVSSTGKRGRSAAACV
jgi:hypothetical protein